MKTLFLLASLGILALPPALFAQNAGDRIELAIHRAQSAGVPVGLLQTKIDEGLAKGIPMDRIAAAVETRAALLIRVTSAFTAGGLGPSEADLTAGADALGAGVSDAVLLSLSQGTPPERRAVAITALTELVSRSIPVDQALDRVLEGLARGAADAARMRGPQAGGGGRPSSTASGVTPSIGGNVQQPPGLPSGGRESGGPGSGVPPLAPLGGSPHNGG